MYRLNESPFNALTLKAKLPSILFLSFVQAESPFNASDLNKKGLLLSSYCLERNSDKMFELWTDLFSGAFKTSGGGSSETSLESLVLRLGQLINMSAVDAVNGESAFFIPSRHFP